MKDPTLGAIEEALEGDDIEVLRPMREVSLDVGAKVAVADYMKNELRPWAGRRVQEQVAPYAGEQARWQRQQDEVLETVAAGMEALGIDVDGRDQASLAKLVPDVVDAVARHQREQEVLGPTRQERRIAELQRQGLATAALPKQPDEIVETAHRIKEGLETADGYQAEIDRIDQRISELTPEAVDAHYLKSMQTMYPYGWVPLPGTDARPVIDADLMRTLAQIGITFQE